MEAMKRSLVRYENPHGNPELKRQIAKRMPGQARQAITDEMVVTSGCIEAVSLCLQAVGNAGDTVVVESPTYPWFLQIIEDQNQFALEIPTDPQTVSRPSRRAFGWDGPCRAVLTTGSSA